MAVSVGEVRHGGEGQLEWVNPLDSGKWPAVQQHNDCDSAICARRIQPSDSCTSRLRVVYQRRVRRGNQLHQKRKLYLGQLSGYRNINGRQRRGRWTGYKSDRGNQL